MQPQSLLGSGMIPEETPPQDQASLLRSHGSMPTEALTSLMAPPPVANPGLAMGSGAQAAAMGQVYNPYLQQQQRTANQGMTQQQGLMRSVGYLQQQQLAQQAQMLQQQRHQERLRMQAELQKQAQETREKEAELRIGLAFWNKDDEASQQIGLRVLGKHLKGVHNIDAISALRQSKSFAADELKDINHMIMADVPLQDIQARYPRVTPEFYEVQTRIVKHPITGPLLVPRPKEDPKKSIFKEESERVKDFLGANPGFKGDPEIYNEASILFRQKTGRELTASSPEDKPLVEILRITADASVTKRRKDERIAQLTEEMVLREQKEQRTAAAKGEKKEEEPIKPTEIPLWVHKKTRLNPDPSLTLSEIRNSKEYVRLQPGQSKILSQAGTVHKMLSDLSDIAKRNPSSIPLSSVPGSALFSTDAAQVQSLMIALPSAVRLFGEVGNLSATEQARALAALRGIASAEGMVTRVETVLSLVNKTLTGMGLDPLEIETVPKTQQKSGPLIPQQAPTSGKKRITKEQYDGLIKKGYSPQDIQEKYATP